MTATLNDALAEIVGHVPGVTTLYSPRPVIARVARATVSAIIRSPATTDRIHISDGPDGVAVTVHIGVAHEQSAAEVCRAVYEEVTASITRSGQAIDHVAVKVGRVS